MPVSIEGADIVKAAAFIGSGLAMGFGAIGPGGRRGHGRSQGV